jgi:hypothetical protein
MNNVIIIKAKRRIIMIMLKCITKIKRFIWPLRSFFALTPSYVTPFIG